MMFGFLKRKDIVIDEGFRFSQGPFGMATHLREELYSSEALCGDDIIHDDNQVQTYEEIRYAVYHRQHSDFFFCGCCASLAFPELTEEEVIDLRHK